MFTVDNLLHKTVGRPVQFTVDPGLTVGDGDARGDHNQEEQRGDGDDHVNHVLGELDC